MSSIEKLLIRGIRSYDPQAQNVIEFYTPLTIIVGPNGAGKTAIIECLKFATTGDLPPNSKGGAFVYDPKLAQTTEVKAQVRLKFRNTHKQSMIVTRSLQLTQKKTKTEMKTLESLLTTKDPVTGEVSRYSKALDELKAIKKEMQQGLKLELQKLEFLSIDCEKATKLQTAIQNIKEKQSLYSENIINLDTSIAKVSTLINETSSKIEKAYSLEKLIETKKNQLFVLEETERDLSSSMTVLSETDEQLNNILNQYLTNVNVTEDLLQANRNEKIQLLKQIEEIDAKQQMLKNEVLITKNAVSTQKSRLEKMKNLIRLNVTCSKSDLSLSELNEIFSELERKAQYYEKEHSKLVSDYLYEEHALKSKMQQIEGKILSFSELVQTKQKEIVKNASKKDSILKALNSLSSLSEDYIEQQNIDLQVTTDLLAKKKNLFSLLQLEEKISQNETERKSIEEDLYSMQELLKGMNNSFEEVVKLSIKKTDYQKKEQLFKQAFESIIDYCTQHNLSLQSNTLEDVFASSQLSLETLNRQKHSLTSKLEDITNSLNVNEIKLESWNTQVCELKASSASIKSKLESFLEIANTSNLFDKQFSILNLSDLFKLLEQLSAELIKSISSSIELKKIYESFLKNAFDLSSCVLCERLFSSPQEKEDMIDKLKEKLTEIPFSISNTEQKKSLLDNFINMMKELQPLYENLQVIENDKLPSMAQSIYLLEKNQTALRMSRELIEGELKLLGEKLSIHHSLVDQAKNSQKFQEELKIIEQEILLMDKSNQLVNPSAESLESIQENIASLLKRSTSLREESETLSNDLKTQQKELQQMELLLNHKSSELNMLKAQLVEKNHLKEQIMEITKLESVLDSEIQSLNSEIKKEQILLKEIHPKLEEIVGAFQQKQNHLKQEKSSFQEYYNPFSLLLMESNGWEKQHSLSSLQTKLSTLEEEIALLSRQQEALFADANELDSVYARYEKKSAEIKSIERNIKDNLKARSLSESILAKKNEIDSLLARQSLASTSSELKRHEEKLKIEHSSLLIKKAELMGEMKQVELQLAKLSSELNESYFEIEKRHKSQFIKVKLSELALADLDQYAKALDK